MSQNYDTEYTDHPKCPHCGFEDEDWWDGTSMTKDGDQEDSTCPTCGKEYKTTLYIETHFATEIMEEKILQHTIRN